MAIIIHFKGAGSLIKIIFLSKVITYLFIYWCEISVPDWHDLLV